MSKIKIEIGYEMFGEGVRLYEILVGPDKPCLVGKIDVRKPKNFKKFGGI